MDGSVEFITKTRRALAREYFVKPGAVSSVGVRARARRFIMFSLKKIN
jgi:hypothetical protein